MRNERTKKHTRFLLTLVPIISATLTIFIPKLNLKNEKTYSVLNAGALFFAWKVAALKNERKLPVVRRDSH